VTDKTGRARVAPPWSRHDWLGLAVFGAAAVAAVIWLMSLGHGLTFFYDEWDFVDNAATTGYWGYVLHSHNGHPSMAPFTVYEALLHTVGLRHYWPYRLLLTLVDVGCGWLLFLLLRRKVHPLAAAAAAAALMLLGPAWQDLLWPFQIGFLGSVAGGLGALLLLEADSRRSDVAACACLVLSIGCSGVGLAFLAGIAVELLWHRRSRRRLWIPAIPLALFVIWYETVGKATTTRSSIATIVHSMADATATTVGSLVGRSSTWGGVLSVLLGVLVVVAVVRSPGRAQRLAMGVTGLATFWVLTQLARGTTQGSASRYLYPAAALVLVVIGELPLLLARRFPSADPAHRRERAPDWVHVAMMFILVAVVGFAGLAIWWNRISLNGNGDGLAAISEQVRPELDAVVLAGSALPADFRPDETDMPQVQAGPFQRAAAAFGWPDASLGSSTSQPLASALDAMLLRGRPMTVTPAPAPVPGAPGCVVHPVSPGTTATTFALPRSGALVTAPPDVALAVQVRALSDQFTSRPVATIAARSTSRIVWSTRASAVRWQVELTPSPVAAPPGSVATVCPSSPS
jgi:hypothetical protein